MKSRILQMDADRKPSPPAEVFVPGGGDRAGRCRDRRHVAQSGFLAHRRPARRNALPRRTGLPKRPKRMPTPERIGAAQFRNGDFEAAAKTYARVPGAPGAFDQGNAWLMHGQYDAAIASYDRALGFHHGWKDAEENKAIAVARKAKIDASGKDRDKESADAYKPDEIAFDQKGDDKKGQPTELSNRKPSRMRNCARRGCGRSARRRGIFSGRSSPTRPRILNRRKGRRSSHECRKDGSSGSSSSFVLVLDRLA